MAETARPARRLVHVATVPETLFGTLRGQPEHMRAQGFEVHGVASAGPYLDRFAARDEVPVHAIEMHRAVTPGADLRSIARLWRLFRALRPDVVHAHTPKGGLLGMVAAALAGVPVRIYQVHGLPSVTARGARRLVLVAAERLACALAHRVLYVSHSLLQYARQEGLAAPRAAVIHNGSINGVDADGQYDPARQRPGETRARLGIPADALVIGFVGRLTEDKGIRELLAAWPRLRERFPSLHLLVVGREDDRVPLPPEVRRALADDTHVHLTGEVLDVAPYYAVMDVLAFPTYREGFGLVAIEASAMRVPVVATAIPGCLDSVVDGVTGTLVPAADAAALEAALSAYLADPARRAAHGLAGRERALRAFRPADVWAGIAAEYQALLAERGRGVRP